MQEYLLSSYPNYKLVLPISILCFILSSVLHSSEQLQTVGRKDIILGGFALKTYSLSMYSERKATGYDGKTIGFTDGTMFKS